MLEKMIIGTAQFGLDYGANSATAKKLSQQECNAIMDIAADNGLAILDTAEAYGDSLAKISEYHETGRKFEIISKFLTADNIIGQLTDSLTLLSIDRYHTILAHKSRDLFTNQIVQRDLTEMKDRGLTKYVGVSIYTNAEFQQSIESKYVDVIQFPYNLLDNINKRGEMMRRAKEAGKILHARSAYLQGMLLRPFPLPDKLRPLEKYLQQLKDLCEVNNISLTSLALEYVFSDPMIDNVIMGQHKASQMQSNVDMIKAFKNGDYLDAVNEIKVEEEDLLSPRNW